MIVKVMAGKGLKRVIRAEIPADEVSLRFESVAREIAKSVTIPGGYRDSKPQVKVARVKQMFRGRILATVANELLEEKLPEVLGQPGLKLSGSPALTAMDDIVLGQPFSFTLHGESQPSLHNLNYRGLLVPTIDASVSSEEVDRELATLLERQASWEPVVGGPLETGMSVTLDLLPAVADEAVKEGLTVSGRRVILNTERLSQGLCDRLLSALPGDTFEFQARPAEMPVPGNEPDELLTWTVKVQKAERKLLPEANDEFANKVRGSASLLALRGELREEVAVRKRDQAQGKVQAALLSQLRLRRPFPLPMETVWRIHQERMESYKKSVEQYRAALGDDFVEQMMTHQSQELRSSVIHELATFFLMEAIGQQEGITVSDEQLEAAFAEQAAKEQRSVAFIKGRKEGAEDELRHQLKIERLFARLIELGRPVAEESFRALLSGLAARARWDLRIGRHPVVRRARRMRLLGAGGGR